MKPGGRSSDWASRWLSTVMTVSALQLPSTCMSHCISTGCKCCLEHWRVSGKQERKETQGGGEDLSRSHLSLLLCSEDEPQSKGLLRGSIVAIPHVLQSHTGQSTLCLLVLKLTTEGAWQVPVIPNALATACVLCMSKGSLSLLLCLALSLLLAAKQMRCVVMHAAWVAPLTCSAVSRF